MEEYDAIVIGAGPAGSSAAFFLKKKLSRVLLIDKASFPRDKLCGGALSSKIIELLRGEFGLDGQLDEIITSHRMTSLEYRTENVFSFDLGKHEISFTRRIDFDHLLVRRTQETGVEFRDGIRVTDIDSSNGVVTLQNGERLSARIIVGADGVPSMVAKKAGINLEQGSEVENAFAYELHLPRDEVPPSLLSQPKLDLGVVRYGYGWVFPKRDVVTIGIGALRSRNPPLKSLFKDYLLTLGLGRDVFGRIRGHWIPSGKIRKSISKQRCFLVGDAAGFADPLVGEGIYYGMISGRLLAQSINPEDLTHEGLKRAAKKYMSMCKKEIGLEFQYAYKIRELIGKDRILRRCLVLLKVDKTVSKDLILLLNGHLSFRRFWFKSWLRSPLLGVKYILNLV